MGIWDIYALLTWLTDIIFLMRRDAYHPYFKGHLLVPRGRCAKLISQGSQGQGGDGRCSQMGWQISRITKWLKCITCFFDLVGGIPTPLKNIWVLQLGWWNSQWICFFKQTCSKPPTSDAFLSPKMRTKDPTHWSRRIHLIHLHDSTSRNAVRWSDGLRSCFLGLKALPVYKSRPGRPDKKGKLLEDERNFIFGMGTSYDITVYT